jgi:hypothetical protein
MPMALSDEKPEPAAPPDHPRASCRAIRAAVSCLRPRPPRVPNRGTTTSKSILHA